MHVWILLSISVSGFSPTITTQGSPEKLVDRNGKKETVVICSTKELPILELSKHETTDKPFETKLLPKDNPPSKKSIEDLGEGSALGAMATGNFINRIFDLTPDMGCPASAFGVFDVCKNAMDMRNEDSMKKHSEGDCGGEMSNEKNEQGSFSQDSAVQRNLDKGEFHVFFC